MNKHITIQSGDYVLLSDIPNEQVFNLVKECFVNAGFNSVSVWEERTGWSAFYAHSYGQSYSCFVFRHYEGCRRQLSLSDVFNSTNGDFNWRNTNYLHICNNGIVFFSDFNHSTATGEGLDKFKRIIVVERIHTAYTAYQGTVDYSHVQVKVPNTYKITRAFDVDDLQHTDISSVQGRATGKSTARHLELISKAMKSPEQWVKVTNDGNSTMWGTILAGNEIKFLCGKLGLDWMEFDNNNQRIRYMPYQTVKMVTKWELV